MAETDQVRGLDQAEAAVRLASFGPNKLKAEKPVTFISIFWEEVREPMILLLLFTGFLYSLWGKLDDALTIIIVIMLLVGAEVFNEYRAKKTIAALRRLSEPTSQVLRQGLVEEVPAELIVPGDILVLQAGRRVPADARLIESYSLSADESTLTGESAPVDKELASIVYAGTTLTGGRGRAEVVTTGMATELGKIVSLTREARPPRTPLQLAMRELTRWMVWVALGFSTIVPLLGWLIAGQPWRQMVLTGFSLTFATIPEELPIIITMVLALGGYRLSKRKAIAKQLRTVETLGAVTVIATDKTGTLTRNRMEAVRFYPETARFGVLELGVICNDAAPNGADFSGAPLETALLRAAQNNGIDVAARRRGITLLNEFTFDSARRRMSVVYKKDENILVAVKGSPEALTEEKEILEAAALMARDGLRVVAFAEKRPVTAKISVHEAETGLNFVGLVGFEDPPRLEIKAALAACRGAGIRTIMVTGDHPNTAVAVADQVGLSESKTVITGPELDKLSAEQLVEALENTSIFARITPEHKLRIVNALHQRGELVAVTGDGVNDAPALAAADIGVAMGETGTDVAREAAGLILADDNFATIVRAVEEGRVLFENLKKGVRYYLSCKVALIAATLLPVILRVPVPFAPIQIILMELFMDLAASATFAAEPAETDFMNLPPRRPKQPFMDRPMITSLFSASAGLFAAVTFNYLTIWYLTGDLALAQTVAFVSWLIGHVLLALNMRSEREPLSKLGLFSNPVMIVWAASAAVFVLLATLVPGIRLGLKTVELNAVQWLLIVAVTIAGTFWQEIVKIRAKIPLVIICLLLSAAACSADNKPKIIATLFPQYDFVRQVGDGRVDVRLLLPPGVEPHEFEPTPQDIIAINRADIFIYTNKYMEPWVDKILKGLNNKRLLVVDASRGIDFIRTRGGVDPHVWLSLDNARIMVNNVRDALIAKDPAGAGFYRQSAEKYGRQLALLDEKYRQAIGACRLKKYIFGGHSAFGYFNRRYGLTDLAAYKGFSPEMEPTAKDLIELIGKGKTEGIKYVYYEELLSPKVAEMIARETGAQLLLLHGAHNLSKRELSSGTTFLSIMEHNLDNLKIGLEWQAK